MKQFVFRLERLRRLREVAERERARALGEAMRVEAERRAALDESIIRRESARAQFMEAANETRGSMAAGSLTNLSSVAGSFGEVVSAAESEFRRAEEGTEVERRNFAEARKERRVLDRLRDRQKSDWLCDASREEQAAIDENAARDSGNSTGSGR